MRWREWVLAAVGVFLAAYNWSFLQNISAHATDEMGFGRGWADTQIVTDACTAPASVFPPIEEEPGTVAVIFHGLGANRKIMALLGRWVAARGMTVYAVDLPGHGDSREGFSFPAVETCARAVLEQLTQEGKITPDRTALIGHSMGGAIAMRMADSFSAAATIAISPAPLRSPSQLPGGLILFDPPNHAPNNLLILAGPFDPPVVRRTAAEFVEQAGGARKSLEDFHEGQALAFEIVPRASHTSQLFDGRARDKIDSWILRALEIPIENRLPRRHIPYGLLQNFGGLVGIFMLIAPFASFVGTRFQVATAEASRFKHAGRAIVMRWIGAAGVGVAVCYFWLPVGFINLFSGDYLASFVLVVGVVLCVWQSRWWREMRTGVIETRGLGQAETGAPDEKRRGTPALQRRGVAEWRAIAVGVVVGMGTILAIGWWLNLSLYDAWMNFPRWWRFFVLLAAGLPYLLAEEAALGAVGVTRSEEERRATLKSRPYMNGVKRWGIFLVMRGILWGAMVFSLTVLLRGPLLVLLMTMYLLLFSVLQRAGANVIRRRTGSAAAAAVYSAILGAWFVAAVMPIT